jgi:putative nucleotidyltransferase-like protein
VKVYEVLATDLHNELLRCCCRTLIDPSTEEKIRDLLRQEVNWVLLLRLASLHQVAPLLAFALSRIDTESIPPEVVNELTSVLRTSTARALVLAQGLVRLVERFERRSIPVIPYKGPLLAHSAYGHPGLRAYVDLDVLVDFWDYHYRVPDLFAKGWSRVADYGFECTYEDANGDLLVDVHQALAPPQIAVPINFAAAWRRCVDVPLLGRRIRTFAPSDLLIILCVQLAKDVGEEGRAPPLIKVCDIAELVRSHPDMDWDSAVREARRLGALRMLCLGVRTAADLLGSDLPQEIREKSETVPQLASLVNHVKQRILDRDNENLARPELLDGERWHFEVRERMRDRYRPRWQVIRRFIGPSGADYQFVALPRALFLLYWLVRPVRLAGKYAKLVLEKLGSGSTGQSG